MFKNYLTILEEFYVPVHVSNGTLEVGIGVMIVYSLIYAVITPLIGLAANVCVAYVTARFNYAFSKIIYGFVIITMIFPIIGNLPSQLSLSMALGLYDNFLGVFVRSAGFGGTTYLVLYASFSFVPKSFSEAAKMDGASNVRILFQIIFPQAFPCIAAIAITSAINVWNNYSTAMIYLREYPNLAYGLYLFNTAANYVEDSKPIYFAATIISCIPVIVLYAANQKLILTNVTAGGLKG